MKTILFYLFVLLALLGCRREDDPKASDPQPLAPVSAAFKAKIMVYTSNNSAPPYLLEADTLIGPARVFLESSALPDDSVSWQIGTEDRRRLGRSISVLFDNPY